MADERTHTGRARSTHMVIVDAQSVKNADTAHLKGYDAGKKVSGIKRHIAVDSGGLPHAVGITAANVTDRAGALSLFETTAHSLASVEKVLADGGYAGDAFKDAVRELLGADVEIAKRTKKHTFAVIPKRWVVERSFAWLEKFRRLWKNCERLLVSSIGMMQTAFIRIVVGRF